MENKIEYLHTLISEMKESDICETFFFTRRKGLGKIEKHILKCARYELQYIDKRDKNFCFIYIFFLQNVAYLLKYLSLHCIIRQNALQT